MEKNHHHLKTLLSSGYQVDYKSGLYPKIVLDFMKNAQSKDCKKILMRMCIVLFLAIIKRTMAIVKMMMMMMMTVMR